MQLNKSPLSEHTAYGPDVHELLNNLPFPNDNTYSPNSQLSVSAGSTPIPRRPVSI